MAGAPRLSTADELLKELKRVNDKLIEYAADFPDEDCYATAYSIIADVTRHIDECIKELKPYIKEANQDRKKNPDQYRNRARRWCVLNDSRRKSRARAKKTTSSKKESP